MTTRHALIALFIFGAVAFTGCTDDQQPEEALALWQAIHADDYRNFARAPGYETRRAASSPHSDKVDIYINDVLQDALQAGETLTAWPEGSLVVKDGFEDNGALELVAVMEKRTNGWFYAEYFDFSGKSDYSGKPDVCTGCHSSGADFIRSFGFP
jgi:hypothetical protein